MVQLGLMGTEFPRDSLEETLDAIAACGVTAVQFDLACALGSSFPEEIGAAAGESIRQAFATRGLKLAALSAYFNMIGPDPDERAAGLAGVRTLLPHCAGFGTTIVAVCTGSCDPNMWRRHPDNDTREAWHDLVAIMRKAVGMAEEAGVTLAIEPEVNNVVDSALKARRLMDEIGSERLKVVMDGANIFHRGELPRMRDVLDEAFALLGRDIVLAHAKDLDHDGDAGHLPAGHGMLDYPHYLAQLRAHGFNGAIVLHGLKEAEAPECLAFVERSSPAGFLAALHAR
jgi:sugar phosphate isomerase/epimerase